MVALVDSAAQGGERYERFLLDLATGICGGELLARLIFCCVSQVWDCSKFAWPNRNRRRFHCGGFVLVMQKYPMVHESTHLAYYSKPWMQRDKSPLENSGIS